MSKNILIFGGAGFISCVLVEKLLSLGYKVTVVDNFRKGIDPIKSYMPNENLSIEYGDIREISNIKKYTSKDFDAIVLAAGIVGLDDCNNNPKETKEVNVRGWKNVADHSNGIPIIGMSTGSVFGEIKDGLCHEDVKCSPLSLYGITKLEGEKYVLDVGGIALRFATAGGTSRNMRYNLLPNTLTYEALKTGKLSVFEPDAKRTFIDIRDFANSIIFSIENFDRMTDKIYNIGDEDNNWSKRQLVEYIKEKTGCEVDYGDGREDADKRNYSCSYQRINSVGFKCEHSVPDMVDNLLEYHSL